MIYELPPNQSLEATPTNRAVPRSTVTSAACAPAAPALARFPTRYGVPQLNRSAVFVFGSQKAFLTS